MTFQGTIHLPEDATRIQATMHIEDGHLRIDAEGQLIGRWRSDAVIADHRPDGIHLHAEGEALIVNPIDRYGFSDALAAAKDDLPKRRGRRRRDKTPKAAKTKRRRARAAKAEGVADGPPVTPPPSPPAHAEPNVSTTPSPAPADAWVAAGDGSDAPAAVPVHPRRELPVVEQLYPSDANDLEARLAPAAPDEDVDLGRHHSLGVDNAPGPAADSPMDEVLDEPPTLLPPVDPPAPSAWPFVDDPLEVPGAPADSSLDPDQNGTPALDERQVEALSESARTDQELAGTIEIVRDDPSPGPTVSEPDLATTEPEVPPSLGRRSSLSDAVRSARAEPLLSGFRDIEQDEPPPLARDINAEIFGDDDEPPAKAGALKRLGDRWLAIPLARRRAVLGVAILVLAWLLIPTLVASVLVLAGLASCLIGGAGMADPTYTRKLPPQLTEARLLIAGGVLLVVGFLIGLPSL